MKLGKTATETVFLLQQAFGDGALSRGRDFEWHKRFKEGQTRVEDEESSWRPLTSRADNAREHVSELPL